MNEAAGSRPISNRDRLAIGIVLYLHGLPGLELRYVEARSEPLCFRLETRLPWRADVQQQFHHRIIVDRQSGLGDLQDDRFRAAASSPNRAVVHGIDDRGTKTQTRRKQNEESHAAS